LMTILGFFLGVWGSFFRDLSVDIPIICWPLIAIHFPARWFIRLWIYMSLPPHSEIAWIVLPPIAIILQWIFIGFLLGLWMAWGKNRGNNHSK